MPDVVALLFRDFRYATRISRRAPLPSLLAALALALGIAAVTTVFSFVNARLLRPPPYRDVPRLVAVGRTNTPVGPVGPVSPRTADAIREGVTAFSAVGTYSTSELLVRTTSHAYSVPVTTVDSVVLPLLGVLPERGRLPTATEIRTGAPVALVSHDFWTANLSGATQVIGDSLQLLDHWVSIIGVMPAGFGFQNNTDIWIPLPRHPEAGGAVSVIARLAPGATRSKAAQQLAALGRSLPRGDPTESETIPLTLRADLSPSYANFFGPRLGLLAMAAGLVLLVGLVNAGNLLLMRAAERKGEWAVRRALGASRGALIRQSLAEAFLFAVVGAGVGAWLAVLAGRVAWKAFGFADIPNWYNPGVDLRVLAFVLGTVGVAVIAVGIAPMAFGARVDPNRELAGGGVGAGATPMHRHGRRAVVLQVALGVSLTVWALLLRSTLHDLAAADRGYAAGQLISVTIATRDGSGMFRPAGPAATARLVSALNQVPGIVGVARQAAFARFTGPDSSAVLRANTLYSDADRSSEGAMPQPRLYAVSDSYLPATGIPVVSGRAFSRADTAGTPLVALVSQRVAATLWGNTDPINRRFRVSPTGPPVTVVGVVGDMKDPAPSPTGLVLSAQPAVYFSERQATGPGVTWVIRTVGAPAVVAPLVPDAVARALPTVAAVVVRPPSVTADPLLWMMHIFGGSLSVFAGMAAILALLGTYAVFAFTVIQRRREIGIRMALGGSASTIRLALVTDGLRLTGVGVLLGLVLAVIVAEAMKSVLLGVTPLSVWVYAAVAGGFAVVAIAAVAIPTWQASRTEPAAVLRYD